MITCPRMLEKVREILRLPRRKCRKAHCGFQVELRRRGRLVEIAYNQAVTAGINHILDFALGSTSKPTTYGGLINNSGFTALSADDTMSSHSGWTEITGYNEANRPTMTWGSASAKVISASAITFTETAGTGFAAKGYFIATNNTKGGTTGVLLGTVAFASVQNITSDTLDVTGKFSLAGLT